MKYLLSRNLKDESGIGLVEALASVVLITIVLLSVFSVLVQSAKVTKTSEDIATATYIAQETMEEFYEYAKNNNLPDVTTIESTGFNAPLDKYIPQTILVPGEYLFKWESDFKVKLTFEYKGSPGDLNENLTSIAVDVTTKKDDAVKAHMETVLMWGN